MAELEPRSAVATKRRSARSTPNSPFEKAAPQVSSQKQADLETVCIYIYIYVYIYIYIYTYILCVCVRPKRSILREFPGHKCVSNYFTGVTLSLNLQHKAS